MNAEAKESVVPFNYGRKVNELPSAELIRKLLDYNPETGLLTWRWHPTSSKVMSGGRAAGKKCKGYIKVKVFKVYHWAHRITWLHYYGEPPNGLIDHMNGIPDDNRIENLRVVDHAGNQRNRKEQRKRLALSILKIVNCSQSLWGSEYKYSPTSLKSEPEIKKKLRMSPKARGKRIPIKEYKIDLPKVSFNDAETMATQKCIDEMVAFLKSIC